MLNADEIRGYNLFKGLNESELTQIGNLCFRQTYDNQSIVFDPDTPAPEIFLMEGNNDAVQIEIPILGQEDRVVIHTLSKGEAFGWAALSPEHLRTATARCLEKVNLICINGQKLMGLLEADNHLGYIFMRNLAHVINSRLTFTTVAFRHELRKLRGSIKEKVGQKL